MGTLYIDTGGNAANAGSSDNNSPDLSGTSASAAGAVVTLDSGTDLSGVVTSGATQSAIRFSGATNTNQKIFWISAVAGSGGATPTVTCTVAPTGTLGTWRIGGRFVLTPADITATVRAGDTVIFNNSPASSSAALWVFRNAGDSTSGAAVIKGKTGTRPVLTNTSTGNVINYNAIFNCWAENLECVQQGASGDTTSTSGGLNTLYNVKISDGGANGVASSSAGCRVIACEITGVGADGVNATSTTPFVYGCYIHDNPGDGIEDTSTTPTATFAFNIIDTNAARGIYFSGAVGSAAQTQGLLLNNTIYGCGNSGLEIADADCPIVLLNNIFMNNGDAAGEYNAEWAAGAAEYVGMHYYNIFNTAGAGGSGNLSGLTANSTELTTDPSFTNGASGDFSVGSSSPAKAAAYPGIFLGGSTGYLDIGAVQRQEAGGSTTGVGRARVQGGF